MIIQFSSLLHVDYSNEGSGNSQSLQKGFFLFQAVYIIHNKYVVSIFAVNSLQSLCYFIIQLRKPTFTCGQQQHQDLLLIFYLLSSLSLFIKSIANPIKEIYFFSLFLYSSFLSLILCGADLAEAVSSGILNFLYYQFSI